MAQAGSAPGAGLWIRHFRDGVGTFGLLRTHDFDLGKRLFPVSVGLLASGLLGWIALELLPKLLGIRDPEFRYENRLDMWWC